mmetsp:Transcript_3722/g.9346  ORF Transcript_3722/g.9346 Transcript_3722/m.9346 type:complete len:201 (+) Transcript_3722:599-1201(+)
MPVKFVVVHHHKYALAAGFCHCDLLQHDTSWSRGSSSIIPPNVGSLNAQNHERRAHERRTQLQQSFAPQHVHPKNGQGAEAQHYGSIDHRRMSTPSSLFKEHGAVTQQGGLSRTFHEQNDAQCHSEGLTAGGVAQQGRPGGSATSSTTITTMVLMTRNMLLLLPLQLDQMIRCHLLRQLIQLVRDIVHVQELQGFLGFLS